MLITTGEDRNKNGFKSWQLCGIWSLPFCNHRAIKLKQNCVCFTNPCINFHVQSLVNTTPTTRYLNSLLMESIHEHNLLHNQFVLFPCERSDVSVSNHQLMARFSFTRSFHVTQSKRIVAWPHSPPQMRSRRKVRPPVSSKTKMSKRRINAGKLGVKSGTQLVQISVLIFFWFSALCCFLSVSRSIFRWFRV